MFNINYPWGAANASGAVLTLLLIYGLLWLLTLGLALTRMDLDPVTRFMWVFVIISVPVIGVLFYFVLCSTRPPLPSRPRDRPNPLSGTPWEGDPGHMRKTGN